MQQPSWYVGLSPWVGFSLGFPKNLTILVVTCHPGGRSNLNQPPGRSVPVEAKRWGISEFHKNYFTSSDPHHDMLGGGCQVRVVIENMMGRMENLRTLISGFLGLVILVRWALVTMFLSWTTQTGCRIHRTYVSLIGSGEGRHTTHLLKCVPLLSTSQTDWKQSSDVLSDISFDILSDISSDIFFWHIFWHSFWHIFWHSFWHLSDISSGIFFWHIFWHSFWHIFWHSFWHLSDISFDILSDKSFDTLSDISSDISFQCFLTYLLTFFLTYQNQNLTSTASHKKPLCKLYIYLTPRSKSNIHDNFVPVNVIALSASDRPAKRQLSPKMQNACSSTHTHTTCIRPPRQTAVESKHAKGFKVPRLHLMACANHEARRLPLWFFHFFCVGGSAPHIICLPLVHSILPKRGRSTKDCSALLQLLLALRIWNRPPFICHIPLVSLHDFFHDKHQIPSMCSARRLHAHVHALSTNRSQLVAPHMLNSFGHLIGSPNEDRLRTFHHNLRHGCQTKLTSLHKNKVEPTVLAAVRRCSAPNKAKKTRCYQQDANNKVQTWILVSSDILPDISFTILSDISFHILSDISSDILSDIFLTYLLTFFLTYLLTFFLTFLLTWFLTYLLTYLSDISSDILSDISSDILSDISFDILSAISSGISPDILWDISFDILSGTSSDMISDISSDILSDISFWHSFWHIFCHSFWHIFLHISWHSSWHIFWHSFWHIFWHYFWLIFWHSSWHIFWHSFWHIFWHSFWHIFLTFLLTYLLTYLLTFFLTYLLTYLSDISSDISSDIHSDISSVILFDISSDILSDISFAILSDISSGILFDITFWHISWHSSSHIFWHSFWHFFWHSFWHFFWHICCHSFWHIFCHSFWQIFWHNTWGPARHTELTGSRLGSTTPHWTRNIAVGVQHATLNS